MCCSFIEILKKMHKLGRQSMISGVKRQNLVDKMTLITARMINLMLSVVSFPEVSVDLAVASLLFLCSDWC